MPPKLKLLSASTRTDNAKETPHAPTTFAEPLAGTNASPAGTLSRECRATNFSASPYSESDFPSLTSACQGWSNPKGKQQQSTTPEDLGQGTRELIDQARANLRKAHDNHTFEQSLAAITWQAIRQSWTINNGEGQRSSKLSKELSALGEELEERTRLLRSASAAIDNALEEYRLYRPDGTGLSWVYVPEIRRLHLEREDANYLISHSIVESSLFDKDLEDWVKDKRTRIHEINQEIETLKAKYY